MRPAVDGSNRRVRCTKNISSLRMTDPLKSMTASRRHTGPIMSAGSTRSPVSSSSSRTAASGSVSPCWAAPPTVNHHRGAGPSVVRRIGPAEQQHATVVVEQHDARRHPPVDQTDLALRRLRAFGDLEIGWQRSGSAQPQQPHRGPFAQRQGVADGVVVEATGQQHPRLGIGELGDQRHRQRPRVDESQRRGQLVFGGLPGRSRRPLGGVGQRRQPLAVGASAVRVDGDRTRHHRAPGQRPVERLPGQVVAHVQPVQPVGGLERPRGDQQQDHDQHGQRDDTTSVIT